MRRSIVDISNEIDENLARSEQAVEKDLQDLQRCNKYIAVVSMVIGILFLICILCLQFL